MQKYCMKVVSDQADSTVPSHCRHLIPMGYTLAVTLEIADATLGGLAFGVGMTTYSHKVRIEEGVSAGGPDSIGQTILAKILAKVLGYFSAHCSFLRTITPARWLHPAA